MAAAHGSVAHPSPSPLYLCRRCTVTGFSTKYPGAVYRLLFLLPIFSKVSLSTCYQLQIASPRSASVPIINNEYFQGVARHLS
ncbi:hypothetical protein E2C01_054526 [Portunus trituberculatus]|uniref:Uncharacterized protein n=1 Tax=Portunus trituberculatus TaxID=210409 RepID=A0A5B7GK32_PORTR|nr:hypothetical protein [Portunus trituberculatus]